MKCNCKIERKSYHPDDPTFYLGTNVMQCTHDAKYVVTDNIGNTYLVCGIHAKSKWIQSKRDITPDDTKFDNPPKWAR
jgi:hypothetical protein